MQGQITLKLKCGEDIRRFSIDVTSSFEDLRVRVVRSFQFANWPLLKYTDDEGDDISITCNEELSEAIRLAREEGSKSRGILVLSVFQTKAPASIPATATPVVIEKPAPLPVTPSKPSVASKPAAQSRTQTNETKSEVIFGKDNWSAPSNHVQQQEEKKVVDDEEKTYPRIPVEEWDAFVKKPAAIEKPEPYVSVSARTQQYCAETTLDVAKFVKQTMEETIKASNATYPQDNPLDTNECAVLCDRLRKECEQLVTTNAVLMSGLALSTLKQCQLLSEETASMCAQLSKRSAESDVEHDAQVSSLSSLSTATRGECDALSNSTRDETLEISNDIRKLLMNL